MSPSKDPEWDQRLENEHGIRARPITDHVWAPLGIVELHIGDDMDGRVLTREDVAALIDYLERALTTPEEHARRQAVLADMARDMRPTDPQDYPKGGTR